MKQMQGAVLPVSHEDRIPLASTGHHFMAAVGKGDQLGRVPGDSLEADSFDPPLPVKPVGERAGQVFQPVPGDQGDTEPLSLLVHRPGGIIVGTLNPGPGCSTLEDPVETGNLSAVRMETASRFLQLDCQRAE